jgi:hypothetical protein
MLPKPRQRPTHGRLADEELARRARHVLMSDQRVKRYEQVEIETVKTHCGSHWVAQPLVATREGVGPFILASTDAGSNRFRR